MLSSWNNQTKNDQPILIHLSGKRPINSVVSAQERYVVLDGRIEDLEKKYSPDLMPVISEKYSNIFGCSIFSKIPSEIRMIKFRKLADEIHAQNKLFRLWSIPENEHVWTLLLNNGLDVISTDRIKKLSSYLGGNFKLPPK